MNGLQFLRQYLHLDNKEIDGIFGNIGFVFRLCEFGIFVRQVDNNNCNCCSWKSWFEAFVTGSNDYSMNLLMKNAIQIVN